MLVARVEAASGGRGVAQRTQGVDLLGANVQPVGAVDDRRVLECPPQPRDLRLERVALRGRPGPEIVEQPVRADRPPRVEREAHEQLRRLTARDREERARRA